MSSGAHQLGEYDFCIIAVARELLDKLLAADWISPAEQVTVCKLRHVLEKLPEVTTTGTIHIELSGPSGAAVTSPHPMCGV